MESLFVIAFVRQVRHISQLYFYRAKSVSLVKIRFRFRSRVIALVVLKGRLETIKKLNFCGINFFRII